MLERRQMEHFRPFLLQENALSIIRLDKCKRVLLLGIRPERTEQLLHIWSRQSLLLADTTPAHLLEHIDQYA